MQREQREVVKAQLDHFFPNGSRAAQDTGGRVKIHVQSLNKEDLVNLTWFEHPVEVKRSGTGLTIIVG